MSIGLNRTSIGERPHRVRFQNPGPAIPDGDGGFLPLVYVDLQPPHLSVMISPATARDLERVASGTVLSSATHIVKGPFHPQVTTATRIIFNGRVFSVTGGGSPDERKVEMELVAVELLGQALVEDYAWMQPGWMSVDPEWAQAGTF